MARALAAWVHLPDPDGTTVSFGPGVAPPEWAARKITNPKAWANDGADQSAVAAHEADEDESSKVDQTEGDSDGKGDEQAEATAQAPKGNAPKGEWVEYAARLGVEIEDDWKVADIKAAVAAHEAE